MNEIEAAKKLQESYDYMTSVMPEPKRSQATKDLLEAIACGISALREKAERDNPQPLTLEQVISRDGERPTYIKLLDTGEEFWVLRNEWTDTGCPEPMILFHMRWYAHADYGERWLAYDHEPKESP